MVQSMVEDIELALHNQWFWIGEGIFATDTFWFIQNFGDDTSLDDAEIWLMDGVNN